MLESQRDVGLSGTGESLTSRTSEAEEKTGSMGEHAIQQLSPTLQEGEAEKTSHVAQERILQEVGTVQNRKGELQRLEEDSEAKKKARIDLQIAHPESLEAIMEAKKLEMDAYLKYMEAGRQFRGAVLIQQDGLPVFSGGYGSSDAQGTHNTPQTKFCIGSLTKQFTGAALALFLQKKDLITNPEIRERLHLDTGGSLDLATPIRDILPAKYYKSPAWDGITLEHLLRHSSGLSDSYGATHGDELRPNNFTPEDLMEIIEKEDLIFPPGEMWLYSNKGYALLGFIIENLRGGQPLEEFMKKEVFEPCGMSHTGMLSSYREDPDVATGFVQGKEEALQPMPMERHLSKAYSAGAIISTVEDLGAWDKALTGPLKEIQGMMEGCTTPMKIYVRPDPSHPEAPSFLYDRDERGAHPRKDQTYPELRYGFGVFLDQDEKVGPVVYHNGKIDGFTSRLTRYTSSQRSIIVLTNHDDKSIKDEVVDHLEQILFAGERPPER